VHLAINQETGAQLACKIIKRQAGLRQSARELKKFQQVVQQEVKLNASLDHVSTNIEAKNDSDMWFMTDFLRH
jgi:F0F1-type ATP synthase delta subunit